VADNVTLNSGSGGATLATEDVAAVHHQKVKIEFGGDAAATMVSATDPLPVKISDGTDTALVSAAGNLAVEVAVALPAGTNAIGKLSANSGVDIGDVDVTSVAGNVTVVQATAASLNVTEASAAAIKTAVETLDNAIAGSEMQVDVVAALPPGANNIGDVDVLSVVPGTGATNAGKAVDAVAGATDTGTAPLAVRDDALGALTPIEGDYVNLRTDANGALWTHDDALDAALGGSELQVDVVAALPTGANKIGAVDLDSDATTGAAVPAVAQFVAGTDGANARALKTDAGGELQVDVLTLPAVTNAGTFATQVDGAALTALQLIDDPVFTDDAAFTPATSKVHAVGYQADETTPDSVDEGDIGCPRMSLDRKPYAIAHAETSAIYAAGTSLTPKFAIIDAATSGDNTLVASVASKKIRVLAAFMVAAGTVNARFESGASGTALTGQMNLVANSGFVLPYNPLGWFETAATTLLNLELSAAISVDGALTYVEV
jgi:hypothetical protein